MNQDPFAKEHQHLRPSELLNVVIEYVMALNELASTDVDFPKEMRRRDRWPAVIGKEPENDCASHRENARKFLNKSALTKSPQNNRTSDWSPEIAHRIVEQFNTLWVGKGDPCGIIWAKFAFLGNATPATFKKIPSPHEQKRNLRGERSTLLHHVVRVNKAICVHQEDLRYVHDMVTCLYGPDMDRVEVYAEHLAHFILKIQPGLVGGRHFRDTCDPKRVGLLHEIKAALEKKLPEVRKGNPGQELPIPFLKDHPRLQVAVNTVWHHVPIFLGNELASLRSSSGNINPNKGKVFYKSNVHADAKAVRWDEDILLPLVKAVLNAVPYQKSSDFVPKGWINSAKIKKSDLTPYYITAKKGRPPKTTS